jgi:phage gp46-like protein
VETATIAEPEPATSGDIRLFPKINSSELQIVNKDLARDPGLETAVFISLFTERRVDNAELLTSDNEDKRGWWANNDFGSRLWLLYRAKTQDAFTARAEEYAKESLQWLIDDGVINDVQCNAEQDGENLILHVSIYRPDGSLVFFEYYYNWNYQIARRL